MKKIIKYELNKIHLNKLTKFLILLLILALYTIIMILKFGIQDGPLVSLTTWSFFVFCTPIADAGFLIDFPIRLITGIKMIYSELIVWVIALIITITTLLFNSQVFDKTIILNLFHHILNNLYPFGIIIVLSCIGTFLSVYFGDEILDTSINGKKRHKYEKHKNKHKFIIFFFLIAFITILYYYILKQFNISI